LPEQGQLLRWHASHEFLQLTIAFLPKNFDCKVNVHLI
jgi:hypothetical protein